MTRGDILAERTKLFAVRAVSEEKPDLHHITTDHALRGMTNSSSHVEQRHARRLRTLRAILAQRVRLEKDEREYPITPEDETTWFPDLQESLILIPRDQERRINGALSEESERFLRGGTQREHAQTTSGQIESLRLEYLAEADLLKAERDHRKKAPAANPRSIVLNISNSQIAGLNVAGTVDTLQANLTTIHTGGEQRIAEALKALAEAIASDTALSNGDRVDALEHVSTLGEEFAKPKEQRQPGVLRSMAGGLVGIVRHADKVYAVYELLKVAAKAGGYDLP